MPLSVNDSTVLQQVFDPEAAPSSGVLIDDSLPKDPRVTDDAAFGAIVAEEKAIILEVEAALKQDDASEKDRHLSQATSKLQALITTHPNLGSLRNDLAQILRLQHGDVALARELVEQGAPSGAGIVAVEALGRAVTLLSPASPQAGVSPTQCRSLAQAHMQRAALYRAAAKLLKAQPDGVAATWRHWTLLDFEEAASRDFFMAGRFGNEIGKAMAVHTNPTAKLCGQMVQDAMKRELQQES